MYRFASGVYEIMEPFLARNEKVIKCLFCNFEKFRGLVL